MAQEARIDVELTAQQEPSTEELAKLAGSVKPGVWFATPPRAARAEEREPEIWELRSARPYRREVATGTAAVYYAKGRKRLERPFIFADGFNYGPSDLPGLWEHFNTIYAKGKIGFLDQLLNAGIDVILVGFDLRHTYIQANAGVVISAIQRAISERHGDTPLIVGGVSMGGLITRYALAEMEHRKQDHQTETYLSWDSPHNGAWIPLVLQQMAYFFESIPTGQPGPKQAELIRSPAAQQLLWAWVEDAKYSGPVATSSEMRKQFLAELEEYGQFPARPRKLGVANGTGNGIGLDLPAGEVVFDVQNALLTLTATARFQPDKGEHQPIGEMKLLGQVRRGNTSYVPALDDAPGGTLNSFGLIADALKAKIPEEYRNSCFVPSVSAVALDYDPVKWNVKLDEKIESLPAEKSLLDEFKCNIVNSEHSQVTEPLVEWVLERLVG